MKADEEFDPAAFRREIESFISLGDALFEENSQAKCLNGVTIVDIIEGCRVVPGPSDSTGESPIYMVKSGKYPPVGVSLETKNTIGTPVNALALILLHRLQQRAAHGTPIDEGAAQAMSKVAAWLGVGAQLDRLSS